MPESSASSQACVGAGFIYHDHATAAEISPRANCGKQ